MRKIFQIICSDHMSDRKDKVTDTRGQNEGWGLGLEMGGEELRHPEGVCSRATAPWCQKEPTKVFEASDQDVSSTPPRKDVPAHPCR